MSNYNFVQVLTVEDVREVCIRHQYYTRGDCEAYQNMFDHCGYVNADTLEVIAKDIKDHSNTEDSVLDIMQTLAVHIHTNVAPVRKGKAHRV